MSSLAQEFIEIRDQIDEWNSRRELVIQELERVESKLKIINETLFKLREKREEIKRESFIPNKGR